MSQTAYNSYNYPNTNTGTTGYGYSSSYSPGYSNTNYNSNIPYSNSAYTGYSPSNAYGYPTSYSTGIGHTSSQPRVHGQKNFTNPVSGNNYTVVTPGIRNPITGKTHAIGTNTYGYTGTGVYPTGTNANYGYTNTNYGYSNNQYGYHNPHNINIPPITFAPDCRKCHGTGVSRSMFSGTPVPCTRCYSKAGYCKRCYGTGTNYRKGKPCRRCQAGKRIRNNADTSSSDSD